MPNKIAKLELICQKLTEIGVSHIFLWQASRSQLKTISANKWERIHKIVIEAVEQSWSWFIPEVRLLSQDEIVGAIGEFAPVVLDVQ